MLAPKLIVCLDLLSFPKCSAVQCSIGHNLDSSNKFYLLTTYYYTITLAPIYPDLLSQVSSHSSILKIDLDQGEPKLMIL